MADPVTCTTDLARKRFTDDERAQRREDILDSAMAVFEKHGGLEALSFRKLATEMGLSYSAPYRYFRSKDELVNALRVRAYRWIESEMRAATKDLRSPAARLEALARAYVSSGLQRPQRYALLFFNLDDTDVARHSLELRAAKHDALDICTQVIEAGQQAGELPTHIDPLTASHLFWIGAHGLVSLELAGQFGMGRDVKALIPIVIHTLRAGMYQELEHGRGQRHERALR